MHALSIKLIFYNCNGRPIESGQRGYMSTILYLLRRFIQNFMLVVAVCLVSAPAFADGPEIVAIKKNSTILVRAPINTTSNRIGLGADDEFNEFDAEGNPLRIWPEETIESAPNRWVIKVVQIDDQLKLKAAAKFLLGDASVAASQERRYMWVQVFHVTKVLTLKRNGPAKARARFLGESIWYGTAFNAVIEGSAADFTADVAASFLGGSANLEVAKSKHRLKVQTVTDGLKLRKDKEIPLSGDVAKIMEAFEEDGTPQPIFIEFRTMEDYASDKILWKKDTLRPGKYRITTLSFEVKETKANGQNWDAGGDAPDPWFTGGYDAQNLGAMCKEKNKFKVVCKPEVVIDLVPGRLFSGKVTEKDLLDDDPVGDLVPTDLLLISEAQPNRDFDLPVSGQLNYFRITLEPVR